MIEEKIDDAAEFRAPSFPFGRI